MKQLTLMKCSLAYAPFKVQQMQFLFLDSFKEVSRKTQKIIHGICRFGKAPQKVQWWTLRVVGVQEWLVKVVQAMYVGTRSKTCKRFFY